MHQNHLCLIFVAANFFAVTPVIPSSSAGTWSEEECPPGICDLVTCADRDLATRKNACPNGRIDPFGSWCGCCPICIKQLKYNEPCDFSHGTTECQPGLICHPTRYVCLVSRSWGLTSTTPSTPPPWTVQPIRLRRSTPRPSTTAKMRSYSTENMASELSHLNTDKNSELTQNGEVSLVCSSCVNGVPAPMPGPTNSPNSKCFQELEGLEQMGISDPSQLPSCTANGNYRPVQCIEGVCYCVTPNGFRIPGYRADGAERFHFVTCACAQESFEENNGAYVDEKCDRFGNFIVEPIATVSPPTKRTTATWTWPSTARTWTWPTTAVPTTSTSPSTTTEEFAPIPADLPPCEARLIQVQMFIAANPGIVGMWVPRCSDDGFFDKLQCMGSACYCVTPEGSQIGEFECPIGEMSKLHCDCPREMATGRNVQCDQWGNYMMYHTVNTGIFPPLPLPQPNGFASPTPTDPPTFQAFPQQSYLPSTDQTFPQQQLWFFQEQAPQQQHPDVRVNIGSSATGYQGQGMIMAANNQLSAQFPHPLHPLYPWHQGAQPAPPAPIVPAWLMPPQVHQQQQFQVQSQPQQQQQQQQQYQVQQQQYQPQVQQQQYQPQTQQQFQLPNQQYQVQPQQQQQYQVQPQGQWW